MTGISIVLPNYNHAAELETSLGAIVGQSWPFEEVLIVDDCSTDNSLDVIARFSRRCPQLRLLRNEKRLGVAATVNRGIESASSPYVVLASADEKVANNISEVFHRTLETFPDIKLAVSCYSEWDDETGIVTNHGFNRGLGMWYAQGPGISFVPPAHFRALLEDDFVWLGVNTAMFKREALLEVGGFDASLQWHCDWFVIYAVAFRYGYCAIPETLASFRLSPNSYSARGMRDRVRQAKVMRAIIDKMTTPPFADIGRAVHETPAAISPFVRSLVPALLTTPRHYGLLMRLIPWWLGQVARMRRPTALLRLRKAVVSTFRRPKPSGDAP